MANTLFSGNLPLKGVYDSTVILSSSARTSTTTGDEVRLTRAANSLLFVLDVTAAAAAGSDTLDVKIQTAFDVNDSGSATWVDCVAFPQVLGDGGAKRHFLKICMTEPQSGFTGSAALAANSVRHIGGDEWRAVGTIAGGGSVSFTYSVVAIPM